MIFFICLELAFIVILFLYLLEVYIILFIKHEHLATYRRKVSYLPAEWLFPSTPIMNQCDVQQVITISFSQHILNPADNLILRQITIMKKKIHFWFYLKFITWLSVITVVFSGVSYFTHKSDDGYRKDAEWIQLFEYKCIFITSLLNLKLETSNPREVLQNLIENSDFCVHFKKDF